MGHRRHSSYLRQKALCGNSGLLDSEDFREEPYLQASTHNVCFTLEQEWFWYFTHYTISSSPNSIDCSMYYDYSILYLQLQVLDR